MQFLTKNKPHLLKRIHPPMHQLQYLIYSWKIESPRILGLPSLGLFQKPRNIIANTRFSGPNVNRTANRIIIKSPSIVKHSVSQRSIILDK